MSKEKPVLGLVGSPNKEGRTDELVRAVLDGAAQAGVNTELVQMSDFIIKACCDCVPWVCNQNMKCSWDDRNFEILSEKILNCGGLVLGTPVYWGDTSGMVKYLILKIFRIFAGTELLWGLPAIGIANAGGSGNGMVSGLKSIYHLFYIMRMRSLEPLPAIRFNHKQIIKRAGELGNDLAGMANERQPFNNREECMLWYDSLPYLNENRAAERRLLAALALEAVSEKKLPGDISSLAHADIIAASGRKLDSLVEISEIYESSAAIYNELNQH